MAEKNVERLRRPDGTRFHVDCDVAQIVRPTVMHDAVPGDPMWLVNEHGDQA